ncbi:uncharacterized protein LOC143047233 isoform X1 [Mytilus galloprovincialis]|uniref:uncharacterized protein LOC143047233 isoform X1 n=1 Tax=Mytilus galloprovincialis TaxID=29158 RepID=UPI003F7CC2DC
MDRRGTPLSVQYELDSLCIQEGCDLNSSKPTKTTKYELDSSCDKDNPGKLIPILTCEKKNGLNKLSANDTSNKKQTSDCSSVAENLIAKINERQFCDTNIETNVTMVTFHQNNLNDKFKNTKDNVKIRNSMETGSKLDHLYDINVKVEKDEEHQSKLSDCSSENNSDNYSARAELAIKIECNDWTLNAHDDSNNKTDSVENITNNVILQNPFEKAIAINLNKVKQEVNDDGTTSEGKQVDRHTVEKTISIHEIKQEVHDVIRSFNEQTPFFKDGQTGDDAVADDGDEGQIHMYIQDNSPLKKKCSQINGKKNVECGVCHKLFSAKYIYIHRKIHKDDTYICTYCGKGFKIKGSLNCHVKIHTGDNPHKCDQCGKTYRRSDLLKTHMIQHSGYSPHKCDVCGKCFTLKSRLKRHLIIHSGEKPFKCSVCDQGFTQRHHMTEHMITHTGVKKFCCNFCGKSFGIKSTLTKHLRIHNDDRQYKCRICGKGFITSFNLKVHERIHSGEKPYSCVVCFKRFANSCHLNEHLTVHTKEKRHRCQECGKSFSTSSKVTRHMLTHTGQKPFICHICGGRYSQKGHLTEHERTHTNDYPYRCSKCDQGFVSKSKLDSHEMKHLTSSAYKCTICGGIFSTKDDKLIHFRKDHADEYKFDCTQCLEVYRQEKQLEQHMRSHLGIKPYKCEICNKHFTQTSSLNLHLKIHTGEKKFSCEICDKLFRTKHGLRKHSLTHTRVKDPGEECETCGIMFRNKQALQCHMHTHNKDYFNSTRK